MKSSYSSGSGTLTGGSAPRLPNMPSAVEFKGLKFLIFDAPSDRTVELYLTVSGNICFILLNLYLSIFFFDLSLFSLNVAYLFVHSFLFFYCYYVWKKKEMEKYGVTDVVRVCDPTYDKKILEARGIKVHVSKFFFFSFV